MQRPAAILVAALLLTVAGFANAAGDPAAGKAKAGTCVACHGIEGVSAIPMYPNLKGQQAQYLVKQLKDFKSGARKDPIMAGMAMPLSEQDIDNLAAYYSSLK